MALKVYNTLTRRKEEFEPINPGRVGIYVCGVTVYGECHIGHARTFIAFDAIVRYLKHKGYEVAYVRNFTDVDDKIIKRAQDEGVPSSVIAERYIGEFHQDMAQFNMLTPDYEPRVTENMDDIIRYIQRLVDSGWAYVADGSVYFDVSKFRDYGKLSKQNTDDMLAGARVEIDERKEDPLDFALWKASKPGEPRWPSPWGEGRPGWHIECSVMSMKYLGDRFDIHAGGSDLIFPHHENEIAQSEALIGPGWVKYWLHAGMVQINREKMSKSLGNFITIKDALKRYHPEVIRYFVLSFHYRSPIDFGDVFVKEKGQALERIYTMLKNVDAWLEKTRGHNATVEAQLSDSERKLMAEVQKRRLAFLEAMDDDFNTGRAIGEIFKLIPAVNRYLNSLDGESAVAERAHAGVHRALSEVRSFFYEVGDILGVFQAEPRAFLEQILQRKLTHVSLPLEEIERLIRERDAARKRKDWKLADSIRNQLAAHGIILQDSMDGTLWTVAD